VQRTRTMQRPWDWSFERRSDLLLREPRPPFKTRSARSASVRWIAATTLGLKIGVITAAPPRTRLGLAIAL
jgi:hypothetical protein